MYSRDHDGLLMYSPAFKKIRAYIKLKAGVHLNLIEILGSLKRD